MKTIAIDATELALDRLGQDDTEASPIEIQQVRQQIIDEFHSIDKQKLAIAIANAIPSRVGSDLVEEIQNIIMGIKIC